MMNKIICRSVLGAGKLINKFKDGNSEHQGSCKNIFGDIDRGRADKQDTKLRRHMDQRSCCFAIG